MAKSCAATGRRSLKRLSARRYPSACGMIVTSVPLARPSGFPLASRSRITVLRDATWLPRARFPVPSLVPGWHVFAIELASGGCCQVDGGGTGSGPNPAHSSAGGGGTASNVTSTLASLRSATVHEDPLHAPENPDSRQPESGVALRAIVAPSSNVALHALPQSIPAGLDVTVPEPVFTTVRTCLPGGGAFANVAATERSASSTTLHSPDPWQSPLHPPNTLAPSGTATSVSWVPAATFVVQGALQSATPVAWIFPPPVPWTTRVSTCVEGPTSPEGELGIVDPHAAHRLHAAVASTSERIWYLPLQESHQLVRPTEESSNHRAGERQLPSRIRASSFHGMRIERMSRLGRCGGRGCLARRSNMGRGTDSAMAKARSPFATSRPAQIRRGIERGEPAAAAPAWRDGGAARAAR